MKYVLLGTNGIKYTANADILRVKEVQDTLKSLNINTYIIQEEDKRHDTKTTERK